MELTRYLSRQEFGSLNKDRLKFQLSDRFIFNQLLCRPINRTLLNEIELVLEGKPVPRRYNPNRNGPVRVYKMND